MACARLPAVTYPALSRAEATSRERFEPQAENSPGLLASRRRASSRGFCACLGLPRGNARGDPYGSRTPGCYRHHYGLPSGGPGCSEGQASLRRRGTRISVQHFVSVAASVQQEATLGWFISYKPTRISLRNP